MKLKQNVSYSNLGFILYLFFIGIVFVQCCLYFSSTYEFELLE